MKNMLKLIVSDLDGTLLPYNQNGITDDVICAIEAILDVGCTFAISSGRTYGELVDYLPMFRDRIYYICCDGAMTVKDGKVLYARKIETSDIELFFKNKSNELSFVLHGAFENYCFGNVPEDAARFNCSSIDCVYGIKDKIFKITSYGDKINLPDHCGIRTHWDGTNKTAQYVNRYSNKGTALSDLQMRLMLTKYDTAVLGDRGNDVCMTKGAKLSYCIGDRCPELAEVSTYRFDTGAQALINLLSYAKQ